MEWSDAFRAIITDCDQLFRPTNHRDKYYTVVMIADAADNHRIGDLERPAATYIHRFTSSLQKMHFDE